jgi:hypothetical protein
MSTSFRSHNKRSVEWGLGGPGPSAVRIEKARSCMSPRKKTRNPFGCHGFSPKYGSEQETEKHDKTVCAWIDYSAPTTDVGRNDIPCATVVLFNAVRSEQTVPG